MGDVCNVGGTVARRAALPRVPWGTQLRGSLTTVGRYTAGLAAGLTLGELFLAKKVP